MKKVLYMAAVVVLCIPTSVAHYDLARDIYCSYRYIIGPAAEYYGVPAKIIIGVIAVESGGKSRAASRSSSARGLMQVLKGTRADMAAWFGNPWFATCDPYKPFCAIHQGTGYMALLRERHRLSSWEQVLYAYRHGYGALLSKSSWGRGRLQANSPYIQKIFTFAKQAENVLRLGNSAC